MKKFIIKTTVFSIIVVTVFVFILGKADGYTDPFYIRFTTPKQNNLILGTSRSAQGLQPKIFDGILTKDFFNYSFTISHSPFGSVYLNSIKKKLNSQIKEGIFIITVDPWSISQKGDNPNDSKKFEENNLALANVNLVNLKPNFEYLIKQLKGKYYTVLTNRFMSKMFLHNDGWLEVNISMDSASITKRLDNKIKVYRKNNLPNRKLSYVRLSYLKQTVEYLKLHGNVYIVRLPVSPEMFAIEQELMPDFNEIINPICLVTDGYLDMTNENYLYQFIDGNHLWKESGKLVSEKIAEWIKSE
jgi:hypothetical protein